MFNQIKNTNEAKVSMEKMFAENNDMRKKLDACIQKVWSGQVQSVRRGRGNQSFAIALLDKHLNVLSYLVFMREMGSEFIQNH